MITITKMTSHIRRFFENTAKSRLNSELLRMGRERVEALGYSYVALRIGPSAWPWRKTTQDGAGTTGIQAHPNASERSTTTDHNDSGITRIENNEASRRDRSGNEFDRDAA